MKINKTLLLALLLSFCFSYNMLNAQSVICGYDLAVKNMKETPFLHQSIKEVYQNALREQSDVRVLDELIIPITFHIVWKDSIENIPDSLINQQIDVLNESYRRTNANMDEVRSEFADVVGDAHIQFVVADIIRIHTDTTFEVDIFSIAGLPDYVKLTEDGGSDAIDIETTLNIWICSIQPIIINGTNAGVVLGYAYPPSGLDHWPEEFSAPKEAYEGVVLDYKVVGRNNPNLVSIPGIVDTLLLEGRSAVHEVGHYLGLRHTWADANTFQGENGCNVDDGVNDTPLCASASNFDCNHFKNSCNDETNGDDLPDMVENYMDYATDACMNSFTNGQIRIMRSVLRNSRCQLVGDCSQVGVADLNFDEQFIISPNPVNDQIMISTINSNVKIKNVKIYNSTGKSYIIITSNFYQPIEMNLSSGLYFMQINSENGSYVSKFIVQ